MPPSCTERDGFARPHAVPAACRRRTPKAAADRRSTADLISERTAVGGDVISCLLGLGARATGQCACLKQGHRGAADCALQIALALANGIDVRVGLDPGDNRLRLG